MDQTTQLYMKVLKKLDFAQTATTLKFHVSALVIIQ